MKYYYVSLGINCTSRRLFDYLYNKEYSQPFTVFDWGVSGDLKDCAHAINNNFKNYFDIISVKKSDNNLDFEKIKILIGDESRQKLQRQDHAYKQATYQSHKYYPSIIEFHYDMLDKIDREKMERRIERLEYLIKNKKPILFVRVIIYPYVIDYNFFNITYVQGLKNCYEFLSTLNSIENVKVLFIHYSYNPKIKKNIISSTSSYYLDSYQIISNYKPIGYSDKKLFNEFLKSILDKYEFVVN